MNGKDKLLPNQTNIDGVHPCVRHRFHAYVYFFVCVCVCVETNGSFDGVIQSSVKLTYR